MTIDDLIEEKRGVEVDVGDGSYADSQRYTLPESLREHLEPIRENEEAVEQFGKDRNDRLGAAARYFLNLARGKQPDPEDSEAVDLPSVGGTN